MYSQIGLRGVPWQMVMPSLSVTNGIAIKNSLISGSKLLNVQSAAAPAVGLKFAVEISPIAAASWLPLTIVRLGSARRRSTTSFG